MPEGTNGGGGPGPVPVPSGELAPGGPRAKAQGCLCSVLANAAYRSGAQALPCIDPRCPMHAPPSED
ncbi:hypothetical protein [Pseudonocardia sp. HH130629-09]|uniref:hypothetical protein n=1 Tax=Pseudonocardia sp. HH130629-09 TaxID=1641402 RepID=UPI000A6A908F|nr:hypothetical protein [Pseudonocardia sp. HH130629-09]